jgi:hypothetical protein
MKWPHGPMARRLTTNQEIAGSIPAVVTTFHLFASLAPSLVSLIHSLLTEKDYGKFLFTHGSGAGTPGGEE